MQPLLDIQNLKVKFKTQNGIVNAVNGVSLSINPQETLGIVGESGCGKSVSMMSVLGLVPQPPGKIDSGVANYQGVDLLKLSNDELRKYRSSKIGFIFQDPMTSLNPVLTIGKQISEPLEAHKGLSYNESRDQVVHMLEMVGIPNPKTCLNHYPHQFSGGMRQRVMIAMSLICSPQLLIADEPTTALDVTIQAQIIDLVKRLRSELNMAVIWITHDLGVIANLADRVAVMYAGYIVEMASTEEIYKNPVHPYTKALLDSLPRIDRKGLRLRPIEGLAPILMEEPKTCPFAPRCKYASQCRLTLPALVPHGADDHLVACWLEFMEGGAAND